MRAVGLMEMVIGIAILMRWRRWASTSL